MFDPMVMLARTLEREQRLRGALQELVYAVEDSGIGPLLPPWQMEDIESSIASSIEEVQWLEEALAQMKENE